MNALQYLMLGMSASVTIGFPLLVVKAVRRKQKYRLFEIPAAASLVIYLTVDIVWPTAIQSAPLIVHRLLPILFVLWIAELFGVFRWLFNRQKVIPVERS